MQFGPVPISQATGAILAHSLRMGGQRLRKGRVLSADDVAALAAAGQQTVIVARLDASDIAEDEAARRIAGAIAGAGIRIGAAFTGRANLYAEARGLLCLDAERVAAINAIDEAVTLATLPPFTPVEPRQMVATIKIIPFAAPESAVAQAERLAGSQRIGVAPFRSKNVALLSTALPETRPALLEKNRTALEDRLTPLGSTIGHEARVPHEIGPLTDAILDATARGADPILIFGASAITDRRDVIPAAITAAGGTVEHFGMPVDPGNLLLLGRVGSRRIVGLPSCARSPKVNGFDFVLWRLLADRPLGGRDLTAMGVGGLLSEIHTRPQPRELTRFQAGSHAPAVAAVVLAAGLSSRMGRNKLVQEIEGRPLVRHVVETALASPARPVIVVTGNDGDAVKSALEGLAVRFVENPRFRTGLSTSLNAGIAAVPPDCDGAMILLGDMPGVSAATLDRLLAAFQPAEERAICVATHRGRRGNPVLWAREFFADIRKLEGDVGARSLLAENADLVCEVEMDDEGPLLDIDTPEALAAYRARTR